MLRHYAQTLPQSVHKSLAGFPAARKCYFIDRQALNMTDGMRSELELCSAINLLHFCES